MSKIGNKELAQAIEQKYGLGREAAAQFVAAMFEVLGEQLQEDKLVKIKGLGTFKVTTLAPRRSVDVNTGASITIESRDKISFTPDATLRDKVNSPFSQFETVVVNDGVDFAAIDDEFMRQEDGDEEDGDSVGQANADPSQDEDALSILGDAQPSLVGDRQPAQEEGEEPTVESGPRPTMPGEPQSPAENEQPNAIGRQASDEKQTPEAPPSEPIPEEKPTQESTIDEQETPQQPPARETTEQDQAARQNVFGGEKDKDMDDGQTQWEEDARWEQQMRWQRRVMATVIAALAVILVVVAGFSYHLYKELQFRDDRISKLEALLVSGPHYPKDGEAPKVRTTRGRGVSPTKSQPPKNKDVQAKPSSPKASTRVDDAKPTSEKQAATKAVQAPPPDYSRYEQADVRIRTGAYRIVGIDRTVTVKAGQTLASIARSTLGPGMECYIEAANGGRKEFKAGERINIPKIQLKKRSLSR